jgi:hypothetical protein
MSIGCEFAWIADSGVTRISKSPERFQTPGEISYKAFLKIKITVN